MRLDEPSLTVGLMPRFGDGFMSTELPHYCPLATLSHFSDECFFNRKVEVEQNNLEPRPNDRNQSALE